MSLIRKIRRSRVVRSLTEDLSNMRRLRKRTASTGVVKPEEDFEDDKGSSTSLVSADEDTGRGTSETPSLFDNEQKRRQLKMKQLPNTSCFSSIHVLVNRERIYRGIELLVRCRHLDALAKKHADEMAAAQALKEPLCAENMAENVQRGPSIKIIHQMTMVGISDSERANILSKRFAKFGTGTAKGEDGMIYMSQVFQEVPAAHNITRRPTI